MVLPEFIRTIYHEVEIHESGAFEKLHFEASYVRAHNLSG
jgi:hypothetical protein